MLKRVANADSHGIHQQRLLKMHPTCTDVLGLSILSAIFLYRIRRGIPKEQLREDGSPLPTQTAENFKDSGTSDEFSNKF